LMIDDCRLMNEKTNKEDRMYCEIYRCHMSVAACIARQKNARDKKSQQLNKPGALDINCQNCEQGRKIMEKQNQGSPPDSAAGRAGSEKNTDKIEALIDLICLEESIDRKFLHSRTYSKKKLLPLRVKLAQALNKEGLKKKEIAQKIGCAEGSVWNYMKTGKDEHPTSNAQRRTSNEKIRKDEKIEGPEKNSLVIDFSKHPDVLDRIKEIAKDELREPGNQVLYWLKEFSLIVEKEGTHEQHH